MGSAAIAVPDRAIVPEEEYNKFLAAATDPENANYWDVVVNLPKTEQVRMAASDNVFSLYEMANGWSGVFHAGGPFHPRPEGLHGRAAYLRQRGQSLHGRRLLCLDHLRPSAICRAQRDADGWYRIPVTGDPSKTPWPKLTCMAGSTTTTPRRNTSVDCISFRIATRC